MNDHKELHERWRICATELTAAFARIGRMFHSAILNVQRSFLVNRRTRRAMLNGRVAAAKWYSAEHQRRAVGVK